MRSLSAQLEVEFGRGFGEKSLRRMVQFAEAFPDPPLQREFYAEMCHVERWSMRALRSRIDSMLYERTALSKKPAGLIEQDLKALREEDRLTPDWCFAIPETAGEGLR